MSKDNELVTKLINNLIAENRRTATTQSSKKDQEKEISSIFKEILEQVEIDNED